MSFKNILTEPVSLEHKLAKVFTAGLLGQEEKSLIGGAASVMRLSGMTPDDWQADILVRPANRRLILASRQTGKSATVAALATYLAVTRSNFLVLLISRSARQSGELMKRCHEFFWKISQHVGVRHVRRNDEEMELSNRSRVIALPSKEETIRVYSNVGLLVLDEAARIPDDLYGSVRPMLAVSGGMLWAVSTPFGKRGWFWQEWSGEGSAEWTRTEISWDKCPRITPQFIADEERSRGRRWVDQEYRCQFNAVEGAYFDPDAIKAAFEGKVEMWNTDALQGWE